MEQKTRVVAALVEGNSVRSTVRMTGVAKNTVLKLVLDLADGCAAYHDRHVRSLKVRRLQCDEIWQYVGAKSKNPGRKRKPSAGATFGLGRQSTQIRNYAYRIWWVGAI